MVEKISMHFLQEALFFLCSLLIHTTAEAILHQAGGAVNSDQDFRFETMNLQTTHSMQIQSFYNEMNE